MIRNKVFIIAEIGVNHNGKITQAFKLIDEAKKCGAHAVKFQTYITDELVSYTAPLAEHHKKNLKGNKSHYKILKDLELNFDDFIKLKKYTKKNNLKFISTPYDIKSLNFLIDLKIDYIKFASSELINFPMLDIARKSNLPIIISTGMSTLTEVKESINFILKKNKNLIVLKCTSSYPTSVENVNLRNLTTLNKIYKNRIYYGFSDHTLGSIAAVTSLKYNVKFIEKHFTLSKSAKGPDHKASLNPIEFQNYVRDIKEALKVDGSKVWKITKNETLQKKAMRKGCYARRNLKKNTIIEDKDVMYLRPPNEITPKDLYLYYLNKRLNRNVKKGEPIKKSFF